MRRYILVHLHLIYLLSLHADKSEKAVMSPPARRLKGTHPIFGRLAEVIKDKTVPHPKWYPPAEQAINAIYTLHEKPDELCSQLIKEMAAELFGDRSHHSVTICFLDREPRQTHSHARARTHTHIHTHRQNETLKHGTELMCRKVLQMAKHRCRRIHAQPVS